MSKCLAMFTIGNNRSMECLDFMINEKWEKVFVIAIGHSLVCCWPQAWPEFKGNNVCKVSLENWINKKDFKWNFAQTIFYVQENKKLFESLRFQSGVRLNI